MSILRFIDRFRSRLISFIASVYLAHIIQFIKAILLAKFLGAYFFGIYSFCLLLIQYMVYFTLGSHFSINILLASVSEKKENEKNYARGILILILFSFILLIVIMFIQYFKPDYIYKYLNSSDLYIVFFIAIFSNFNMYFINVLRVFGMLKEISIYKLLVQIVLLPLLFLYTEKDLFRLSLIILLITQFSFVIYFYLKSPLHLNFEGVRTELGRFVKKGISLLLYNNSVLLLFFAIRTIITYYYTVVEVGVFSFSFNLVNTLLIAFQTFIFVVFPKMINKLSTRVSLSDAYQTIERIRKLVVPSLNILVVTLITFSKYIFTIFEEYQESYILFNLILLSYYNIISNIGYNTFLIARDRQNYLVKLSGILVFITSVLILLLIKYSTGFSILHILYVAMISSIFYSIFLKKFSLSLLDPEGKNNFYLFKSSCVSLLFFMLVVLHVFFSPSSFISIGIFSLFLFYYRKKVIYIFHGIKNILRNEDRLFIKGS